MVHASDIAPNRFGNLFLGAFSRMQSSTLFLADLPNKIFQIFQVQCAGDQFSPDNESGGALDTQLSGERLIAFDDGL